MDAINHVPTIPVQRHCSLPAAHFSQPKALGIEAASFASILRQQTTGFFERDENLASKDIAESPTATAETPI